MKFAALMMAGVVCLFAADNDRKTNDIKRIQAATTDLIEIQHANAGIPLDLLRKAHCVGIIPSEKRVAFLGGAQWGKGIVTCRIHGEPNRWSAPSMMSLDAGSFGLQAGAAETDVVFTVMNDHAELRMKTAKVVLGVDVTGAAGPVGRSISAETNGSMRNEILTWSQSSGVFAGVMFKGGSLRNNDDDNKALYGHPVTAGEILDGKVPPPPEAHALYAELAHYARPLPKSGE